MRFDNCQLGIDFQITSLLAVVVRDSACIAFGFCRVWCWLCSDVVRSSPGNTRTTQGKVRTKSEQNRAQTRFNTGTNPNNSLRRRSMPHHPPKARYQVRTTFLFQLHYVVVIQLARTPLLSFLWGAGYQHRYLFIPCSPGPFFSWCAHSNRFLYDKIRSLTVKLNR